jgi:tocopherol cyclase
MKTGSDPRRDLPMLKGKFRKKGYDWWWHSFTGKDEETGEEKGFFIEFFLVNPALGKDEPVFGQLPENQKDHVHPSYLMVKAGGWGKGASQLHRFFGWKKVLLGKKVPFSVQAGDCFLSETETHGSIAISAEENQAHPEWFSDSGTMSWKLKIHKEIPFNVGYGAGKASRDLEAFQMYWHAEGMKSTYEGEVLFNGRKYKVTPEESDGYADKNWGSDFTSPWLWLASSDITSLSTGKRMENSAFDIGGGRPKIGLLALDRKLLGCFSLEGKRYEYNFSKFWTHTKTSFSFMEGTKAVSWHVDQKTPESEMITDVTCAKKDMLFIRYEAPDGTMKHSHLFNGGTGKGTVRLYQIHRGKKTLIDSFAIGHVGCEYGEYNEKKTARQSLHSERRRQSLRSQDGKGIV